MIIPDTIIGSDGCGIVVDIGEEVDQSWLNKSIIINPNINWGNDEHHTSYEYTILGMPVDGTLAEYIVTDVNRIHEVPSHLTLEEASALPLAGLTAYRALFVKGGFKPGQRVLVTGIGSGVAQYVAQFASAAGGEVWVTSSSDKKIENTILRHNIEGGVKYTQNKWWKELSKRAGQFDLIVDGAGGDSIDAFGKIGKLGSKIVSYGATRGPPKVFPIYNIFLKQMELIGSTMGSDVDFENMINFIHRNRLVPVIDSVYDLDDIHLALDRMGKGKNFGKIVIRLPRSHPKL
eukprot:TRINITY_DN2080_c0_g1_i4.p1 TRINITY_DN2080_c0_g1~~TRINITY_DN2080_c0_g1_i4.p1  ORF type:complete len:290 (-),score=52.39 TRINITY_DN2080_c0_g1_i4:30-899(-)